MSRYEAAAALKGGLTELQDFKVEEEEEEDLQAWLDRDVPTPREVTQARLREETQGLFEHGGAGGKDWGGGPAHAEEDALLPELCARLAQQLALSCDDPFRIWEQELVDVQRLVKRAANDLRKLSIKCYPFECALQDRPLGSKKLPPLTPDQRKEYDALNIVRGRIYDHAQERARLIMDIFEVHIGRDLMQELAHSMYPSHADLEKACLILDSRDDDEEEEEQQEEEEEGAAEVAPPPPPSPAPA
jgi:hypothetical protein